jgi:capsular polysaccharide biosynthesis protein
MEDIAQAFLKRPGVILLVVLGFVGPTLVFTLLQPTVYEASAKAVLEPVWGGEWEVSTRGDSELLPPTVEATPEAIRETMEAIDNPATARAAIERLGLEGSMEPAELSENLTVEHVEATQFVQLSYRDTNPLRAQRIANAVAEVASEESRQEAFVYGLRIQVWEGAALPNTPVSPNPVRNAALALILGLMVAPVLAIWMDERPSRS